MVILRTLDYNMMIPVDEYYFEGCVQTLFLRRKATDRADQYFLDLFVKDADGNLVRQGYLYFFVHFLKKESKFVGAYINPLYRNKGLASLLVANWIKICFDRLGG